VGFSAPFRNYVPGDFFYGFSGCRAKLIKQLCGKSTQELASAGAVAWLDQLLTAQAAKACPLLNADFADYLRNHSKWKVVPEEDRDIERKAADPDDPEDCNNLWRKKSKAGLEFLVKKNHFINFAIDEKFSSADCIAKPMNYEEVAVPWGETRPEYCVGKQKLRIITYAEIRFVYRNKDDADFAKRIQFWYQSGDTFAPGAPPWVRDAAVWEKYQPKNSQPAN